MALCGASGETHHNIAHVLYVQTVHGKDYDSTLAKLGRELHAVAENDTDKTLVQANGMFMDNNFVCSPYFTEALERDFHTKLHQVDFHFNTEEARKKINNWVAEHTFQKIIDLMPSGSLDSNTRLVLANAIYFKGTCFAFNGGAIDFILVVFLRFFYNFRYLEKSISS